MNRIDFTPLIELATKKDKQSGKVPKGTSVDNTEEWDLYQDNEIKKNYENIPKPISPGVYQYKLLDIGISDLEKVIKLHIGDTDINASCSLFGGYAVSVNGNIELYPQCCGLFEEIQQWKKILDENFKDFYLLEGHPSPLITKRNDKIIILCNDDNESFFPSSTMQVINLDYQETKSSFLKLLAELESFSAQLNTLSSKFGTENISNILIWGNETPENTSPNSW